MQRFSSAANSSPGDLYPNPRFLRVLQNHTVLKNGCKVTQARFTIGRIGAMSNPVSNRLVADAYRIEPRRSDPAGCRLTRRNQFTGELAHCDFEMRPAAMWKRLAEWDESGAHIQHAFGDLSADLREFLLNGVPLGEFEKLFGPEEEGDPFPGEVEEPAF